jgi:hypothetical protein
VLLTVMLLLLSIAVPRGSSANTEANLILHAAPGGFVACDAHGLTCAGGAAEATIDVTGIGQFALFLLVNQFESLAGVQCAFTIDASWTHTFGLWDCQPNSVVGTTPTPPWGETDGSITIAFDFVTGGQVTPVGRLMFAAATSGCADIDTESSFPFGTHIIDDQTNVSPVMVTRRGKVCVGAGGVDPCALDPVEATTWGQVKSQYR